MLRTCVRRPVACTCFAVALFLIGALAWCLLPVAALPQVELPLIQVSASLPGASPESMAKTVAAPLERALSSVSGVTDMVSYSTQGASQIELLFEADRDVNDAARAVQAAINIAQAELPAGMPESPTYSKRSSARASIMAISLSSSTLPLPALYEIAATVLAPRLSQVQGVGGVEVQGSSMPALRVQMNPKALTHYGVALDQLRDVLVRAVPLAPSGAVQSDHQRWELDLHDEGPVRASDLEQLTLKHEQGASLRLGHVARISKSVEDRYTAGFHNSQPAVIMVVTRQVEANIIETIDALYEVLPALRAMLPGEANLTVVTDRSPGIRAAMREAHLTLGIATVLVVLVVWFFVGQIRVAVISCVAIVVSLVATFAVMYLCGFSLNNLSLMALIVSAGLVVDDAIVVQENIARHLERGLSPPRAAFRGASEVGFTLVAMTVSLAIVFVSVLFMGGMAARLFKEFSITLIAATLISLVVCLTVIPSLCARWLRAHPRMRHEHHAQRLSGALQRAYGNTLSFALRHPWLMLAVLASMICANVALYIVAPKGFLPSQDTGHIMGFVKGEGGASFALMQPKIDTFRHLVQDDPAVQDVVGYNGGSFGVGNAFFMIRLKPLAERGVSAESVIARLQSNMPQVPGATLYLTPVQDLITTIEIGASGSYGLRVLASDVSLLREWTQRIASALRALPEISGVVTSGDESARRVRVQLDREVAARLGVDVNMVAAVLSNSFSQRQIATLYDHTQPYRIVLELDGERARNADMLEQVEVIAADGRRVPLSALATYEQDFANDYVMHIGLFAATNVGFTLAEGVSLERGLQAVDQTLDGLMLPTDIQARLGNGADDFLTAVQAQPTLILGALVAIYLVLGMLYESPWHPLTILSTLPSVGIGALLALRVAGMEFTLIALLGLFLLFGVVMKNAILMVDFARVLQRRKTISAVEAIHQAAVLRLRPILMTNLAALLGALPLVLDGGDGGELRRPLGLAIVGGLLVSQFLTLYTTPVVYLMLSRLRGDNKNNG
ncbi:efflux RND transporter permease subunit [Bordetella sp. 15P40C-2]|uniref:efflux RND transporter permease subunit n=1 Tax=Bordetella sp. 15P40C-2 TaxID=2572246 RepID=UPI00132ADE32|nr:efflux RND transporter permease subunit [Bordetella sp. 15P40C-2]MVW71337.1 acriflavine resistance protein B [Bordetella sp. 15P40C-2]